MAGRVRRPARHLRCDSAEHRRPDVQHQAMGVVCTDRVRAVACDVPLSAERSLRARVSGGQHGGGGGGERGGQRLQVQGAGVCDQCLHLRHCGRVDCAAEPVHQLRFHHLQPVDLLSADRAVWRQLGLWSAVGCGGAHAARFTAFALARCAAFHLRRAVAVCVVCHAQWAGWVRAAARAQVCAWAGAQRGAAGHASRMAVEASGG
ncbi:hypothetical protein SDC9_105407 [bioreactor metagenome]|uniref:Uncharacterized protein n=1 Tax=bioreactor metagenome TaxID=1076179 RepID=A0A645B0K5_9ZZZZ